MRKRKLLNICMVLTILLAVACGIMAVGSIEGWFDTKTDASFLSISEKSGIAMIERNGIAYEVDAGTAIREGDTLYTKKGSGLTVADAEKSRITLDSSAEIAIVRADEALTVAVLQGDALIDARNMTNVTATSGDTQVVLDGAVVSVSTQAGSGMVYVYSGSAALTRGDESMTVESGHVATFVAGGMEQAAFAANSLSEGQMAKLVACGMDDSFCLTKADLDTVRAQREAEKQKAQQELIAQQEAAKQEATKQESAVTGTTDSAQSNTEDTEDTEEYDTASYYCAIEIRCDTILDNMGNLTPGKESYVPASGTILGTTRVGFDEGETVFDVLKRVCDSAGIQIEYSWTPIYDSYYVEGINHLYEFDCGELSGWMYKVNGWFPNYGSSSYDLENGDTIVWCYTCEGLGADVGGSVF